MYRLAVKWLKTALTSQTELERCNMNYNAERYIALKRYEREVKRDKLRAILWNVSITSIYAMVVIQVFRGFIL